MLILRSSLLLVIQPFPQSFPLPQTFTQFKLFIQPPLQPPPSLQSLAGIPLPYNKMTNELKNLVKTDAVLISPCFPEGKHDVRCQYSRSLKFYCSGLENW